MEGEAPAEPSIGSTKKVLSMRKTFFIHGPQLEEFHYPSACPFNTSRAALTRQKIISMGMLKGGNRGEALPIRAPREELEMYHDPRYLDILEKAGRGYFDDSAINAGLGTPDCPMFDGMYDYASWASGASITGMKMILGGEADTAFNPSGGYHHAFSNRAAGFCYVNDVVLACMTARKAGKRVVFLDVDVHHSDGVQAAFYDTPDVMTISFHESGKTLFPGTGFENETGRGAGLGYSVNVPLPVGTYDEIYLHAFREVAIPLSTAYKPDVIVVELGLDALAGDPLAHLHLTNNTHADILNRILAFEKPLLVTGGGGYHVENTVRGWTLAWSMLCGDDSSYDLSIGMGGVMLQNTDWAGGLRDRFLLSDAGRRGNVDAEVNATIDRIRARVFPFHGLR
jgi:acetoin utilization protein AcuC